MSRRTSLALLVVAACGGDTSVERPDASIAADAAAHHPDGATVTTDGSVTLTDCQEATMHSDFAWIQEKIFTPACATAQCHSGPNPEVGLNLAPGAAYNNLVNKGTSTVTGWKRVVPGSLTASYLVVSFGRAEGPPPRDGFMPLGDDYPLCPEKLEAIERWILAGAQP